MISLVVSREVRVDARFQKYHQHSKGMHICLELQHLHVWLEVQVIDQVER